MTPFARRILAVLAISAVSTVQSASAQQAFVTDATPPLTGYQGPAPRQPQPRGSWEANNYRVARRTQMEAEVVQPKQHAESVAPNGWGDEGSSEGASSSGDCGCESGSCDSGCCGCNSCRSCCNRCDKHCGWYAGGAVVWAKPFFQHNTAFTTSTDSTSLISLHESVPFEYDYETTPRVWLGYENSCGLGVRGRYWQFDHRARGLTFEDDGATSASVFLPELEIPDIAEGFTTESGDVLTVSSKLKVQTVDLEATQRFQLCRTDLVGSIGARYARLDQEFEAILSDGEFVGALEQQQDFEGVGLTAALEARRPICCCCCNLALVGSVRGSILFGQRNVLSIQAEESDGIEFDVLSRSEDEVLAIGEIMGGVEWSRCCCRGTRLYAQAIVEGQIWEGAGNATYADSNLGFLGYGFTVGVAR